MSDTNRVKVLKICLIVKFISYIVMILTLLGMAILNFIHCEYLSSVCDILCSIVWIVVCILFMKGVKRNVEWR